MTTTSHRLSFSSALALAAFLAAPVAAQEPAPPDRAPNQQHGEQTLNVKFRGGSLADYVSVIRNAGEKINIVMPPSADDVRVPALSIIDAEVKAALEVAAEIADEKHRVAVKTHRSKFGLPIHVIQIREVHQATGPAGAFTLSGAPVPIVRVFSLRTLTERLPGDPDHSDYRVKPATIITAIDTGLAVAPDEGAPEPVIRYHEDSGLLFVKGTAQQTGMVSNVLKQMEDDIGRRRSAHLRSNQRAANTPPANQPGPAKKVQ